MRNSDYKEEKKKEIMERCFECYCDNGLRDTGIKELGKYCNMTSEVFMALSPENPSDILRFIEEIPYWTAKKHGKKYRLMYQVYTHPKYVEQGKLFFDGVSKRYTEYAKVLSPKLGIPSNILSGFIFIFVRAAVHYALFEDEYYLKMQMEALKLSVFSIIKNFKEEGIEKK